MCTGSSNLQNWHFTLYKAGRNGVAQAFLDSALYQLKHSDSDGPIVSNKSDLSTFDKKNFFKEYFEKKINFILCNFLVRTLQYFLKN